MTTGIITVIVAFITAVVGPIALEWVKNRLQKKDKKSSELTAAIEFNERIDNQLDVIMDTLECDRVWLAQFHNGGHFYPTGRSIQKFSIFYEKVSSETPSIQNTFQNIPVSLFSKIISKLHKDGEIALINYPEDDEFGLQNMVKEYEVKSWYTWALHDLDGKFIGVLSVSFTKKPHKFTKDEWIFIRQKIGVIGSLLSSYLYYQTEKRS
jgi:GAF domain-containing protein